MTTVKLLGSKSPDCDKSRTKHVESLPNDIKTTPTFSSFNTELKKHMTFYRPPKSPIDHLEQLELSMNNLKLLNGLHGKHVILGGDFNLPDINWQDRSISANQQNSTAINEKMVGIMDEFNLIQMVLEPTHQCNILSCVHNTP